MAPFIIFIILIVVGTYLVGYYGDFKNPKRAMFIYSFIVILLFCGGVDGKLQGGDITNYYNHAVRAQDMGFKEYLDSSGFEIGYKIFVWTVAHVFKNPQVFMFIQYGFVNFVMLFFCYKNTIDYYISLICYICLGSFLFYFTAFRQGVACAICIIAIMEMQKKRIIVPLLLILFATFFHQTSIVFLPFLLASRIPYNSKTLFLFVIGETIVILLMRSIIDFANDQFEMDYGETASPSIVGGIINIIIFLILLLLLYKRYHQFGKTPELYKEQPNGILLFLTLTSLLTYSLRFSVLALERVSFYFLPALNSVASFSLDQSLDEKTNDQLKYIFVVLAVVLVIVRFNHTFGSAIMIF